MNQTPVVVGEGEYNANDEEKMRNNILKISVQTGGIYFDFVDTYKIRISDKEKTRAVIEKLLEQDNVTYAESTIIKIQN